VSKETYNRPKETYNRPKETYNRPKETYNRPKETYSYAKRDLQTHRRERRQPAASAPRARMQQGIRCAVWRLFAPKRDAHASSTRIRRGKARREGGATHMHACTHARTRARTHTHLTSMSPSYSHREIHTYIYITYILAYILTYSDLYYTYSTCLVNTVWRPIARTWRPALGFSVSSFGAGGWCFLPGDGASSCGVSAPERGVVMGVSRSPV